MTSAARFSWALRRSEARNALARWRETPAWGLVAEGRPGKPVVKVRGWGVVNSKASLPPLGLHVVHGRGPLRLGQLPFAASAFLAGRGNLLRFHVGPEGKTGVEPALCHLSPS